MELGLFNLTEQKLRGFLQVHSWNKYLGGRRGSWVGQTKKQKPTPAQDKIVTTTNT